MPRNIGDSQFFTLIEVCRMVGVHRTTLLRWLAAGKVPNAKRDRHGWRLFSQEQVEAIKDFALFTEDPAEERHQLRLFSLPTDVRAEPRTRRPGTSAITSERKE